MFYVLGVVVFLSRGAPSASHRRGLRPLDPHQGCAWTTPPPLPLAIRHLLHQLTQAAKFHVLIEKKLFIKYFTYYNFWSKYYFYYPALFNH